MTELDGLILPKCRSIHTWFMRMAIDVVVIDNAGTVLRCIRHLAPWRITRPLWRSWAHVELTPGAIERSGTQVSDQLAIVGSDPALR